MYPLVTQRQRGCRTESCPLCGSTHFKRNGFFTRHGDARRIQRFLCKGCGKSFSRAGYTHWYRYRHRRLNPLIHKMLTNSGTLRGIGRIVGIHPDTVGRHLDVLAKFAREQLSKQCASAPRLATHVQMDDLITFEHTALKQVSVTLISDADRYRMLGACVSRIPTSGKIAQKAREKYGIRPDESIPNRRKLLRKVSSHIAPRALICTDQHVDYPPAIKTELPGRFHASFPSKRAAIVGQGEMKEGGFDPLFCINHHLASLRAFISRLVRRTWNTTKLCERLDRHIVLFMAHYNDCRRPKKVVAREAAERPSS